MRTLPLLAVVIVMATFRAQAQTPTADLLITGGEVVTANDAQPSAQAAAVRNGRVVAVGMRDEAMRMQAPQTRVLDLAGQTLARG
jgi:predicted amidohydrolase YtcJ